MLAYILAIAVGLASLTLYLSAFFLPELHRKDDFLWSGVGLFYALVLWICAGRMTGGVLLGQAAAVALVLSFGWQTVKLRKFIAYPDEKIPLEGFSLVNWVQSRLGGQKKPPTIPKPQETPVPEQISEPVTPTSEKTDLPEITPELVEEIEEPVTIESLEELIEESSPEAKIEAVAPSPVQKTPSKEKKGFSLGNLFRFGQKKSQPKTESIRQALDEIETVTTTEEISPEWDDEIESLETPMPTPETTTASEEEETPPTPVAEEATETPIDTAITNPTEETEASQLNREFSEFIADGEDETIIESYEQKPQSDLQSEEEVKTPTPESEPEKEAEKSQDS